MHVDAETEAQIHELIELRTDHRKRLHALERQAAQQGISTPPHITTEIEIIKEQVVRIEADITKLYVDQARWLSQQVWELDEHNGQHTPDRLLAIWRKLGTLETAIHREASAIYRLVDEHYDRHSYEGHRRRRRQDVYSISIIVLLVVLILIVLFR